MEKCSLIDFFNDEEKQELQAVAKSTQDNIIIIDGNNMAYRSVFSSVFMNPEDNSEFFFFRHLFMNNILSIVKKFPPKKIIIAFDEKNSWRYDVFPEYKSGRKQNRDTAVVDFEKFFPVLNKFKEDLKETFSNVYFIQEPHCEGDDTIAVLSKYVFNKEKVVIISTDKDFNQLLNENISQYDPIKAKIFDCINPRKDLELKLLTGDKSDGIPPIRKRVGICTAEAILKNGLEEFFKSEDPIVKENYIRNTKLIDFNYIPNEIKQTIINSYNNTKITEINSSKLMKFFVENKLMKIMSSWQNFDEVFKVLK